MADLTIPGWALVVGGGFFGIFTAWFIWVTVTTFQNKHDIKINEINDVNFRKYIGEKLEDVKLEVRAISKTVMEFMGILNKTLENNTKLVDSILDLKKK